MDDLVLKENMYLGSLCKRGHDYRGTGKSVRYKNKGRELGGMCVFCNMQKNKKDKRKATPRGGPQSAVKARCPRCKKLHETIIDGGWAGAGIPWKYCGSCDEYRIRFNAGRLDYGYTA